jgi:deoxyribodipyrimidine photo-lyase
MAVTLVWFRQDLRLHDNPALADALARGAAVPVYIQDDAAAAPWAPGGASRWWLHRSLAALDASLRAVGSRLVLARGESGAVLRGLLRATGATGVNWNRVYEPALRRRDQDLKTALLAEGVEARSFNAALLFEPHAVRNKTGGPFQVFTPFWRHCLELPVGEPVRIPSARFAGPEQWPVSLDLAELGLQPRIPWDAGLAAAWQPGEAGAQARLRKFVARAMDAYDERRDFPAGDHTSALSPHLHFGEIGPRQIWAAVRAAAKGTGVFPPSRGAQVFLKEVGWREFAHHLLCHFPHTPEEPLRAEFARFPWVEDAAQLKAWQRGRTGYPVVDAGLRQLYATGWMHNRVRMIAASFLVKHLRQSWRHGAAWFWDTLVDADLASNTLGWHWTAGCGADAAPYFRIFNPILQGVKFDPAGDYVRRWVPELAQLPPELIHRPWEASPLELKAAGVELGRTYPHPIVDHGAARDGALAALESIRKPRP